MFKKWNALKERFEDFNLAAITNIITTFFTKRVQDFKNIKKFIFYITLNLNCLIKIN